MVKVILWPWSKVTQISKLNVWLLACILRWAIQGLLALLFSSPEPNGSRGAYSIGRLRRPSSVRPSTISNNFCSESTGPIATKFHIQPPGILGKKNCSNDLDHMTNMAAMPIYGKNLKKSSSPEPIDQWPRNLVYSILYGSTTKVVQIMTLGWPWPILSQGQIWLHRLLYGSKWKLFIFWKLLQPWVSKLLEAFS